MPRALSIADEADDEKSRQGQGRSAKKDHVAMRSSSADDQTHLAIGYRGGRGTDGRITAINRMGEAEPAPGQDLSQGCGDGKLKRNERVV
jgi:hypothetical protein